MKPPQAVQLSRFKLPVHGKGRVYTVDYGIAKPLYRQLLSKCVTIARVLEPPTNDLLAQNIRIRGRSLLLITPLLLALYLALILPLTAPSKIVYADPLINPPQLQPKALLVMPAVASVEPLQRILTPVSSNLSNLYAFGWCTDYVASRLPVPSDWGNAITWGTNAQAQGIEVSDIPKVGSIAWSTTDSYMGHVALVEAVNGDQVTISEMNGTAGWGVVDTRIANPGEFRFIYL